MNRCDFITLMAAQLRGRSRRAQPSLPVIGVLSGFSPTGGADTLAAFRQGQSDTG